jgi:hypothetical protein
MFGARIGVLGEIGAGQICELIALVHPLLHIGRRTPDPAGATLIWVDVAELRRLLRSL